MALQLTLTALDNDHEHELVRRRFEEKHLDKEMSFDAVLENPPLYKCLLNEARNMPLCRWMKTKRRYRNAAR